MITNLKELEHLFKLCRKQGVTEITVGAVVVRFGDMPAKQSKASDAEEVTSEGPTDEEIIFFSSGGGAVP